MISIDYLFRLFNSVIFTMNVKNISIAIVILLITLTGSITAFGKTIIQPEKINDLWYTWTEQNTPSTNIYCSYWNGTSWNKPTQITNNEHNSFAPAAALDKNGNPWIVWAGWDGVSSSIYCRNFDGKNWSKTTQVDDVDIHPDTTPAITIDNNNIPWVTWSGYDGASDDIYVSSWTGRNWSAPVMINTDNLTPDVMPVISEDQNNNIIAAWCGFLDHRYKMFFSRKINNTWSDPKIVTGPEERLSVDFPNIIKRANNELELLWYEKNTCFKSLWNGTVWSKPEQTEFLLPEDFFNFPSFGPTHISWDKNNIRQSLRIEPPQQEKKLMTSAQYLKTTKKLISLLKNILSSNAYAVVETNKYIAFGDSITEGVGASDRATSSYPLRLEEKLIVQVAPSTVVNQGVGGERTFQGLARIDEVLTSENAQYILLMEGTNDVSYFISSPTVAFNLGEMIDRAREFGTIPFLANLIPRLDSLANRVPGDYNVKIQLVGEEKNAPFVDQYTVLATDTERYMSDDKHPNDEGYEIIAMNWFDAILAYITPEPVPDDEGGGCGAVPPICKNGEGNGPGGNIFPILILSAFILFLRHRLAKSQ